MVAGYCGIINLKAAVSLGVESKGEMGIFSGVVVDHLVWMGIYMTTDCINTRVTFHVKRLSFCAILTNQDVFFRIS